MGKIAGPQTRGRAPGPKLHPQMYLRLGHHRLALSLGVVRGARAVFYYAYIVQINVYHRHIQACYARAPDGGEDPAPIGIAGEKCGFDQG